MANQHGDFIWYELLTSDADAAGDFYGKVVGWSVENSDTPGMDYRMLAMPDGEVGGMMPLTDEMKSNGARPCWLGYIGVDDVDASAKSITEAGGSIHVPPTDIPNVGRFAFVADPQGVMFYIMKGASDETSTAFAEHEPVMGHCAWNELITTDQAQAKAFYGGQFGWKVDGDMDMGPMGKYEFWRYGKADGGMLGAVMTKPDNIPVPGWVHYFRVPEIDRAAAQVGEGGGTVIHGPEEIPGGEFIINGLDPQGAAFALIGKRAG